MDTGLLFYSLLQKRTNAQVFDLYVSSLPRTESFAVPDSSRRAFQSKLLSDAAVASGAADNMNEAKKMVDTAKNATAAIQEKLQTIVADLTAFRQNDSYTTSELTEIKESVKSNIDDIKNIADTTKFNHIYLMKAAPGSDIVVDLQAGMTQKYQKFSNLLDASAGTEVLSSSGAINLNNLDSDTSQDSLTKFTDAATLDTAIASAKDILSVIDLLDQKYTYDSTDLENYKNFFEHQADILKETSKSQVAVNDKSSILAELFSNHPIISGKL